MEKNILKVKKDKELKCIKNIMLVLFVLTLLSLFIATYIIDFVNEVNNVHGFDFTKISWIYWCFLPISILSIILGFKYNAKGLKCTKNIVAGFIMGILLFIYGSFSLVPTYSEDYNRIYDYNEIIGVNIPETGNLEIINWGTYFDQDKTEYVVINVYYDEEDTSELEKAIDNSDNWFLSEVIRSELKIFVSTTLYSDVDAYYSIYNKTTNEYNKIPELSGNYEIYAMKYDKSNKQLEIHKFMYNYLTENKVDLTEEELNALNEVNNKIIEYFTLNGVEDYENFSFNYVDEINGVVIVGLLDNSEEEKEKFKRLVVDSDLIVFKKGEKGFDDLK